MALIAHYKLEGYNTSEDSGDQAGNTGEYTFDTGVYLSSGNHFIEFEGYDVDNTSEVSLRLENKETGEIFDLFATNILNNGWASQSGNLNISEGLYTIKGFQHISPGYHWGIKNIYIHGNNDTTGNYDAIVHGKPEWNNYSKTSKSITLDGTINTGLELIQSSNANQYSNQHSWSLWFKSNSSTGSDYARILSRDCSEYLCVVLKQSESPNILSNTGTSINIGQWYHLALFTTDGSNYEWYLDGNYIASTSETNSGALTPWVIGGNTEGDGDISGHEFIGNIDDIRLYDHPLSINEIKELNSLKLLHYKFKKDNNILINPGFEEDSECVVNPTGWVYNIGSWAVNTLRTAPYSDGLKSFGNNYSGTEVCSTNTVALHYPDAIIYQDVNVNNISSVYAEAWVYSSSGIAKTSDCVNAGEEYVLEDDGRLHLKALDDNNNVISEIKTKWGGEQGYDGNEWQHHIINNWELPGGTVKIRFQIDGGDGNNSCIDPETGHSGNAGIYMDDCVLVDTSVEDFSSFSHDGVNKSTIWSPNTNIGEGAYKFNGINSAISFTPITLFSNSSTITCWIYIQDFTTNKDVPGRILCRGNNEYRRMIAFYEGGYAFETNTNSNPYELASRTSGAALSSDITAGSWFHFALVFENNTAYGYINGSLVDTVAIVDDMTIDSFGKNSNIISYPDRFKGSLNDIRIYSQALSQNDVYNIYNLKTKLRIDSNSSAWTYSASSGSTTKLYNNGHLEYDSRFNKNIIEGL